MSRAVSRTSSILSTTTRFSTATTDTLSFDRHSIDLVAGGQHFHINKDGSHICDLEPPPYETILANGDGVMPTSITEAVVPEEGATTTVDQETSSTVIGRPTEQLEMEHSATTDEDNIVYPTGWKLWLSISSLLTAMLFIGLDMTIVAVAVPALTDHFHTIDDVGWYSSAYQLFYCSFIFLASRLYTIFSIKALYLTGIATFQLGSLISTVAITSRMFILGRAVSGVGACIMGIGGMVIISYSFPRHRRPLWVGVLGAMQSIAMVSAPLLGGLLIDALSWRACFGINLPFGALSIALTVYGFREPTRAQNDELSFKQKLRQMDLLSTLIFIPAIVCLLIALQWGGNRYTWKSANIIVLFVVFAVCVAGFVYVQHRNKEEATLPPRILKQRTVIAGAWFGICCNGLLAVTEYFISIYFQGVRGFSASKSGLLGVPLIVGLLVASVLSGSLTTVVGYYYPFMLCTSVLAPIAAGLLTTLDLDESLVKVSCLLGFLGTAVGLGLNGPVIGLQNVLPNKDIATGTAVTGFAGGLGSALFICTSSALFQNRLVAEITEHAPGLNATAFDHGGLTNIRNLVGKNRLKDVLFGYDQAVSQTLYIPVALATLTIIGSVAVERKSVKGKRS